MPYKDTELAYIAGFIDGEGYLGICPRKDRDKIYVRPVLTITQTNKDILDWINKTLGIGNISSIYQKQFIKETYKKSYHLSYGDRKAYQVIKLIYPFLKVKKAQARIIIMFYEDYVNERNYSKIKLDLSDKCKKLNHVSI